MRPLGLRCHGGAAACGGGDSVPGGVQQHGQPAAVLLLHQDVQGQHEGRSVLAAGQQKGVLQVRTGHVEKEGHKLRGIYCWDRKNFVLLHLDGKRHDIQDLQKHVAAE